MAKKLYEESNIQAIADAIRDKNGETTKYKPSEMAAAISAITGGGSGGDADSLIDKSITSIHSNVKTVGRAAFTECKELTDVSLPNATAIGISTFEGCSKLANVSMPLVESFPDSAFSSCRVLKELDFTNIKSIGYKCFWYSDSLQSLDAPALTELGEWAFMYSTSLKFINIPLVTQIKGRTFEHINQLVWVDIPSVENILSRAFIDCPKLQVVIMRKDAVCTLASADAFNNSSTYFYVPRAVLEEYKIATNWSKYASQFRALEEYTVDGTVTGDFDFSKAGVSV